MMIASIRRDIAPANSWVIARRDKLPVLSGLEYSLGKLSERERTEFFAQMLQNEYRNRARNGNGKR